MGDSSKHNGPKKDFPERRIETDPRTGLPIVTGGAPITKEKVERDFPVDCCRDAIVLRRSVGLGPREPFEDEEGDQDHATQKPWTKEQVAKDFPRDCCRWARFFRRSVGIGREDQRGDSDTCCFAE